MTSDDRAVLQRLGVVTLGYVVDTGLTSSTLFEGIMVALLCITAYLAVKQELTSTKRILLAASITSFFVACIYTGTRSAGAFLLIRTMTDKPGMPLDERILVYNNISRKLYVANNWAWALLPFLTDLITIWRGVVLFPQLRWGFILALFVGVAELVTMVTEMGFLSHDAASGTDADDPEALISRLDSTGVVLSLAANLLATGLIAYGAWSYRRFFVEQLNQEQRRQFRLYRILRLLVESGLVYCVLQAIVVITEFLPATTPLSFGGVMYALFQDAYILISAMYPTLIALLIKHRGNFEEAYSYHSEQLAAYVNDP